MKEPGRVVRDSPRPKSNTKQNSAHLAVPRSFTPDPSARVVPPHLRSCPWVDHREAPDLLSEEAVEHIAGIVGLEMGEVVNEINREEIRKIKFPVPAGLEFHRT